MSVLAENLKQLRQNAGLTQKELAAKVHTSDDTISSYERLINTPPLEMLVAISEVFGITIDQLVSEKIDRNYPRIGSIVPEKIGHPKDSIHEIYDAGLKGGATLHRFRNSNGNPISAIYKDGMEISHNSREREAVIIKFYQDTYEERYCENEE